MSLVSLFAKLPSDSVVSQYGVGQSEDRLLVISISLFVTLLCACIILGHVLKPFKWINESVVTMILGLVTGLILLILSRRKTSHLLQFNEELFFIYLLPPIIFNAGFQVKKKEFFRNIASIMLYGGIGVFISFFVIFLGCKYIFPLLGLHLNTRSYLALAVIFSATDTVCTLQVLSQKETPLLYSLVFGEGVVNDATSVVLFRTIQQLAETSINGATTIRMLGEFLYLFLTSTFLGVFTGLITAYLIRKLYLGRHSTDREIAIMTLAAYLSYMIAELFYLSGILTVFFSGIVMSHYAWHNITEESRITTRHTFETFSFISETFIFLYVGIDAVDVDKWSLANKRQTVSTSAVLLGLILLGRAAFVFPLSAITNACTRSENGKLSFREQFVIWWAGLIRGAVSIALAFNEFTVSGATGNPEFATLITSTIITVLFSTTLLGIITKPFIEWIIPPHMRNPTANDEADPQSPREGTIQEDDLELPLLAKRRRGFKFTRSGSFRRLLEAPTSTIHVMWRKFDRTYMLPVFGGPGRTFQRSVSSPPMV